MNSVSRTLLLSAAVLLAGAVALFDVTRDLAAFTSEAARRLDVQAHPVPVPAVEAYDQNGKPMRLDEDPLGLGRVAVVDFIYTRCTGLCSALGASYQQLQSRILEAGIGRQVRLLTVSFDSQHDTSAVIADYARRMHVDSAVWTVATLAHPSQMGSLLHTFGVVVVRAPLGEFQHNAAFHVVDSNGRLIRILDIDQPAAALAAALHSAVATGTDR